MSQIPYIPGLQLGKGCNSAINKLHGWALEFELPESMQVVGGQQVAFYLRRVENTQSLFTQLGLSASGAFSGYGMDASAEAKFANNVEINNYETCLLVSVIVQNPSYELKKPRFLEEAKQYFIEQGYSGFEKIYGPEYVAGYVTGGAYHALMKIKTTNKEEQENIAAALSWSGSGADIDAVFNTKIKQQISKMEIQISIFQSGGSGDILETSLDAMVEQAKNFPKMIAEHPIIYTVILNQYSATINPPKGASYAPSADILHRQYILDELNNQYYHYKNLRNNFAYVIDNLADFEEYHDFSLEDLEIQRAKFQDDLDGISAQLNQIAKLARMYQMTVEDVELPTEYYKPHVTLPKVEGMKMTLHELQEKISELNTTVIETKSQVEKMSLNYLPVGTIIASMLTSSEFATEVGDPVNFDPKKCRWVIADGTKNLTGSKLFNEKKEITSLNLSGMFLRGITDGRQPGSYQSDEIKEHEHELNAGVVYDTGGTDADWVANKRYFAYGRTIWPPRSGQPKTAKVGGSETRPQNIAVYYYMKIN
ncbi:hypothetical protein L0128_11400 [candidate division KSB1 bacterium]|nr:hypothetical protein [candidate division KSB1 bacterium]